MGSLASAEKPHAVCIPLPQRHPLLPIQDHSRWSPPSNVDATQDTPALCVSTTKHCLPPFRDLLSNLNHDGPPVTCIVSDGAMSFTLDAAQELGVPEVLFWTTSACGFMGYVQYRNLIDKGLAPLKDESYLTNGYLDTVIDWIPGMKGIRLRDIPSFIRTTDPNDIMLEFPLREAERARKASALIFNTFDALEHEVLDALSQMFPPIYTIGPLHKLMSQIQDNDLKLMESNLWKEEPECLEWLDSKEPNSVVYQSDVLWIIRPDLVSGDAAILPPEFVAETKERGLLAEQQTNCRYCCTEWGIGMEIDSDVKRDEIERLVKELMEGEKGKELKKKALEWKALAEEATRGPNGSSFSNLDKMITQALL
ncbi:7-deoxyloganetin glucosyltransferase [Vitis vinifera]|uniref:7-deoxyloganetin glucosyltransferase n=1 Tax=Vitis vinifera TaxID=29760 RepID=A0A438F8M4_VITVI|nr:7-deoxyloganetin glucosyltransferase [Vitis vinifera]